MRESTTPPHFRSPVASSRDSSLKRMTLNAPPPKPKFKVRLLVLLFASFITVGSYYVYDTPSSLYSQLQEHFMFELDNVSTSTFELYFNLLYSVYSIPNILLPFLGGHLVDTVGMRACIVGFSLLVLLGQLITAFGCTVHSMATMLLGRLIFGMGGECVVVGQSAFISAWFQGKEVAFALGFILSMSRIGSVANDWLSPIIAQDNGVNSAFWFGTLLCACSTVTAILLACIDKSHRQKKMQPVAEALHVPAWTHGTYFETPHPSVYGTPSTSHPTHTHAGHGGHHHDSKAHADMVTRALLRAQSSGRGQDSFAEDDFWHLLGFNSMFWLLATVCLLCYGSIMPFNNIANSYLLRYYIPIKTPVPDGVDCKFRPLLPGWRDYCDEIDRARQRAGTLQSVPFIICGFLTPVIGLVIDNFGQRTLYILLGPILLLGTHILFYLQCTGPILPLCGLGLGYSIVAAVVWPSVPLTLQDDSSSSTKCGTAFGILTVFQNLSMAIFPIAVAALYEVHHDYAYSEIFFMGTSTLGILVAVWLWIVDEQQGSILRLSTPGDDEDHYLPAHTNNTRKYHQTPPSPGRLAMIGGSTSSGNSTRYGGGAGEEAAPLVNRQQPTPVNYSSTGRRSN